MLKSDFHRFARRLSAGVCVLFLVGLAVLVKPLTAAATNLDRHVLTSTTQSELIFATMESRAKTEAKNLVGKLQESAGDLSGSTKDKIVGKAKQSEASVGRVLEDLKDMASDG